MSSCHCGSGLSYDACCEPIINGTTQADTPEKLMRARYSAHVAVKTDFLFASTHPDHRQGYDHQGTGDWAAKSEWHGLEIIAAGNVGAEDKTGQVEFIASYNDHEGAHRHHELAQFEKLDGTWYFCDGTLVKPRPLSVTKIGRNDPCSCGSGQKYKKCCGK